MNNTLQSPKKSSFGQTALFFIGGALVGGILTAGFFLNRAKHMSVATTDVVGESLFKVDGNLYSSTNLPGDVGMTYYQLENSIYDAKSNFANQAALRIALAKDSKKLPSNPNDSLPSLDELLGNTNVSDAEVQDYYNTIISRYGASVFGGQSFEAIQPQLKQQLVRQKRDQYIQAKIKEYEESGRIVALLHKPVAPAVSLNLSGYPYRGNPESSVTLVEVSDYMCPHCRETEPTIKKLYNEFGSKVKFVQITFPLNPNGLNGALARGSFCAYTQGNEQFWKYHDYAFEVPLSKMTPPEGQDAGKFFNDEAKRVAQEAGLDVQAFDSCLVSEDAKQYITRLQSEFNAEKGFQGTPTFYLNNKLIQANPAQLESTLRETLQKVASE